jgi:hypothetical protein
MTPEHGTGGHAGSFEDKDSLQMSLFEDEAIALGVKAMHEARRERRAAG